jgi:hypothetical protein
MTLTIYGDKKIALIDKNNKVKRSYVYVVYECESILNDGKVHGVYINREEAEGKKKN